MSLLLSHLVNICPTDIIFLRQLLFEIINFRFQLNAQYFISVTMLLYMFRATLRPSSGGPLHIYNIWFYVGLFWWPCSRKVSESLTNLPTARSSKETDIEPDVNIQRYSWGWAQKCPKHVEEHDYRNIILCIKLEPEVNPQLMFTSYRYVPL